MTWFEEVVSNVREDRALSRLPDTVRQRLVINLEALSRRDLKVTDRTVNDLYLLHVWLDTLTVIDPKQKAPALKLLERTRARAANVVGCGDPHKADATFLRKVSW